MLNRLARVFRSEIYKPRVKEFIARGDEARDSKSWESAADAYAEALRISPDLTHIRVQYGHMLKESGQIDDAVRAYQHAANEQPVDADVRVHLAHALKRLGRYEEAIEALREAINLHPSDRESVDEIFYLSQKVGNEPISVGVLDARTHGTTIILEELSQSILKGISVVTCARNRTENLLRALPSWLAYTEVSEVVIVDWTSAEPVYEALQEADFTDPRIKVIRIEDEPRWVLSTAFNAGFRAATYDKILKVDADIVLSDGFFHKNQLQEGAFIAGDWRDAEPGQEFINGFFYIHRCDLMAVNGFNEFITTYGWDDDDIYDRLQASGCKRQGVDVSTITHLPHDDTARLEIGASEFKNARAQFWNQTSSKISANRYMSFLLPGWGPNFRLQPFAIEKHNDSLFVGRRSTLPPIVVPHKVRNDAERYTIAEFLSTKVGLMAYELTPEQTDLLMSVSTIDAVTALSTVIVRECPQHLNVDGNYLIVRLDDDIKWDEGLLLPTLETLASLAKQAGFGLVIADGAAEFLRDHYKNKTALPFLAYASASAALSVDELTDIETVELASGECREFYLTKTSALRWLAKRRTTPSVAKSRDVLYVDAQHGLGNRLRAIASGASIAEKSGRELVVVWEPDHHCKCGLLDLFDYSGPLIEESFLRDAQSQGLTTLNYMEMEEDSDRGAPLLLQNGVSAYARSAYVLNHPLSDWETENRFLRSLRPTQNVLDLVDSVEGNSDVSLHVRMEGAAGTKIHSYDSAENWPEDDHVVLQRWREKSHFSNFMTRVDEMIKSGEADTFFLAADLPETYTAFTETYGDRVHYLKRAHFDRSREQMWYALADVILLSRADAMLGSNWSSFSEIALRLSTKFDRIQLSGKDF